MAQLKNESNAVKKYEPTMESQRKLTKEDELLMEKVEKKYGDELKNVYPFVIRTFIIGYSHIKKEDREKETFARIDHYLVRYKNYKFETILDAPLKNEEEMFKTWRLFTYGYDKQGHPVLYDEIGSADIKAIDSVFGNDLELLRTYRFRFHKRLANCKRIQAEKLDTILYKHIMVMDLSGFSSSHFGANYRNIIKEVVGDEQNVFPETLYVMFLINTPWAFRMIWSIASNFIDPITYKKIKVLGGDYIGEMEKFIDIDQIPEKYKGKGKKPIKYGHCSDLPHDRYPLDQSKKGNKKEDNDNQNDEQKNEE